MHELHVYFIARTHFTSRIVFQANSDQHPHPHILNLVCKSGWRWSNNTTGRSGLELLDSTAVERGRGRLECHYRRSWTGIILFDVMRSWSSRFNSESVTVRDIRCQQSKKSAGLVRCHLEGQIFYYWAAEMRQMKICLQITSWKINAVVGPSLDTQAVFR